MSYRLRCFLFSFVWRANVTFFFCIISHILIHNDIINIGKKLKTEIETEKLHNFSFSFSLNYSMFGWGCAQFFFFLCCFASFSFYIFEMSFQAPLIKLRICFSLTFKLLRFEWGTIIYNFPAFISFCVVIFFFFSIQFSLKFSLYRTMDVLHSKCIFIQFTFPCRNLLQWKVFGSVILIGRYDIIKLYCLSDMTEQNVACGNVCLWIKNYLLIYSYFQNNIMAVVISKTCFGTYINFVLKEKKKLNQIATHLKPVVCSIILYNFLFCKLRCRNFKPSSLNFQFLTYTWHFQMDNEYASIMNDFDSQQLKYKWKWKCVCTNV